MTTTDEPIRLRAADATATFDVARGGRLESLVVEGRNRIVGPPDPHDRSIGWGSFLMAPWPGRLDGGVLDWEGTRHVFPPTLGAHAIHGLVWDAAWEVEAIERDRLDLGIDLVRVGWPFGGRVHQRAHLEPTALVIEGEIVAGDDAMPAAFGWHPWFDRLGGEVRVRLRATEVLETRPDLVPTGAHRGVSGDEDLRDGPALGDRRLDHAYVGAASPAVITWPDLEMRIAWDDRLDTVVVFTPPDAFCVEPQSAWPNALGPDLLGVAAAGAVRLGPGERLKATMRFDWSTP